VRQNQVASRQYLSSFTKVMDRSRSTVPDDSAATSREIWAFPNRHPGPKLMLFCLGTSFIRGGPITNRPSRGSRVHVGVGHPPEIARVGIAPDPR
jgi:hypothetical protein